MPSQFIGFDELSGKLAALSNDREVAHLLRDSVRAALTDVVRDARQRIRVGTVPHKTYKGRVVKPGFAKKSIRLFVSIHRSNQRVDGVVGVRSEAFYALQFLELGTSRMAARPWLRPAFAASTDPAISKIAQGMREWIEARAAAKFARALNPNVRVRAGRDAALGRALMEGLNN